MLPVSDLIRVARGIGSGTDLQSASPMRFSSGDDVAPVVIWNVCMHCNMSCPHCYASAVASPAMTAPIPPILSTASCVTCETIIRFPSPMAWDRVILP